MPCRVFLLRNVRLSPQGLRASQTLPASLTTALTAFLKAIPVAPRSTNSFFNVGFYDMNVTKCTTYFFRVRVQPLRQSCTGGA